jgi:histidine ammonia-lyase
MTAARALDLRAPLVPAAGTGAVRDLIRSHVPGPGPDRYLAPEIEQAHRLVVAGEIVEAAAAALGVLE